MLYMDEIFGFFPPVANPPSKPPLLTLLKQGRAAAWRRARDAEPGGSGLQGALEHRHLVAGPAADRARQSARARRARRGERCGRIRSRGSGSAAVGPHEPRVSHAQRARGRADALPIALGAVVPARPARPRRDPEADRPRATPAGTPPAAGEGAVRLPPASTGAARGRRGSPVVPPDVPQYFRPDAAAAVSTPLRPVVYGAVNVRFVDPKLKVDATSSSRWRRRSPTVPVAVDWEKAARVEWAPEMLETDAPDGGDICIAALAGAQGRRTTTTWRKQLTASLVANESHRAVQESVDEECSRARRVGARVPRAVAAGLERVARSRGRRAAAQVRAAAGGARREAPPRAAGG